MPTISILTATRNAQEALPCLLASLAVQKCRDFELIVQDGLSTDATGDSVHRYTPKLPFVRYVSEKDTGIYDAWNKGLRRASGEWIIFLGADDALHSPASLQEALKVIATLPDTIAFFATSLVLTLPNGEVVEECHPAAQPLAELPSCMPLPHPALFYRVCPMLPVQAHICLVVTVVGRTEPLKRLLQSLQRQTYTNFTIILVDQHPPHVLEALPALFPSLAITHIHIAPTGVSHARNVGLQHARGDIIAFPDDDCWYEPDTLAAVVAFFSQHPDYAGLLGSWIESVKKRPLAARLAPLSRYSAFAGGGTHVQFYRREAVLAVGEFDTTLGPGTGLPWGCGEDTDYVLRAVEGAWCIGRDPCVRVHHQLPEVHSPMPAAALQKHRAYALGRMFLLKKHGFSLWFKLLNVLFPLALLPVEAVRQGRGAVRYRWAMFRGRLRGLFL